MTAGLKFESAAGTQATNLSEVKIITLEDKTGNKYTLGLEGTGADKELKLKYTPKTGDEIEHTVDGLVKALGDILGATESTSDGKTKSILVEKLGEFLDGQGEVYGTAGDETASDFLADKYPLAKTDASNLNGNHKKAFAEAILGATSDSNGKKSILVEKLGDFLEKTDETTEKVYGDPRNSSSLKVAKDFLAEKSSLAKIDASNLNADNKKAFAKAILPAQDGKKSILVEELGNALDRVADNANDKVYGQTGHEKIAKDFLAEKSSLAKIDASNLNADNKKAFAEAILGVEYTDSESKTRSVLVEKLGKSLGHNTDNYKAKYDGSNEQTAIDFLKSKGLEPASASEVATQLLDTTNKNNLGKAILGVKKDGTPVLETDLAANKILQDAVAAVPALKTAVAADQGFRGAVTSTLASPAEIANVPALKTAVAADAGLRNAVKNALASDTTFQGNVKITVNSNEPRFQGSVREVMSKPVFEIPADDNAPLSWDW